MAGRAAIPEAVVQSLRTAAARAAELAGGGVSLVFATAPGGDSVEDACQLRAAAGFPDADAARRAAQALRPTALDALAAGRAVDAPAHPALGAAGAGGVCVRPLSFDDRRHGVLLVAGPGPLSPDAARALAQMSGSLGLQLDHMQLRAELAQQRERTPATAAAAVETDPDELLKLSEQLFSQDIELLRRDEQLGKVEKLKNDFIEKMSRELRTPLNSIIEAIIAVIANESDRLSDGSLESLRNALDQGSAFQRTLENILDLWRIKQNELPVEIQEVNFAEVVEEAIFSVQDSLGQKPVAIEKEFREALPKVRTDLAKVNQILFQVLENAAKFTERGTITIAPRIEDGALVCEVSDTGIGICPDDQTLVYDEFFQVDEMSSTRYRGAGLGLTLVRDLLVLLGGEISLSSEPGKGSTFCFRIPVQPA